MHLTARTALLASLGLCVWLVPNRSPAEPDTRPSRPAAPASRVERKTYEFKDAGKAEGKADGGTDKGSKERDGGDKGVKLEYDLFVPTSYDKAKKTPLVVALHGLYSNPWQILHYPGLTEQAEKYGYIVVAPMGYNNHGWYGATPLVRGNNEDPADLSALSARDVMNVLDLVRKAYNIDPDRTYLMGHSMGGGGTWELAIKHPDLWAALAPIAPATIRPATDARKIEHLPVILVQGDQDILVRVDRVRPWAEEMKKLGMDYEYDEIAGGSHISVAFTSMPKIFAFFDKHKRGEKTEKVEKIEKTVGAEK